MKRPFLALNLLKTKLISVRMEVVKRGACPMLVFLTVVPLQSIYILTDLLQYLFELTLGLTGTRIAGIETSEGLPECLFGGIELPFLRGVLWWYFEIVGGIGGLGQHTLCRRSGYYARHFGWITSKFGGC